MIESVNKALDILTCIADNKGEPASIKNISQKTGINKSTCCHIINTLVERGYIVQISRVAGYVLGIYTYNLTRYSYYQANYIFIAEPILRWIQRETGYNALFANLINGEKFILKYLDTLDNKLESRGQLYKGDLYNCATGRAMLATMNSKEIKALVNKVGLPDEKQMKGAETYEKLLLRIGEFAKEEVIKYEQPTDNYEWEFAVAIKTKKNERFALGVGLLSKKKPNKKEIENIKRVLIRAKKELIRRIEMSDTLIREGL